MQAILQVRSSAVTTAVIDYLGEFVGQETNDLIYRRINVLYEQGIRRFVLNLDKVTLVDASVILEFVTSTLALRRLGAELRLCAATHIREALEASRALLVLPLFETEAAALDSFEQ